MRLHAYKGWQRDLFILVVLILVLLAINGKLNIF